VQVVQVVVPDGVSPGQPMTVRDSSQAFVVLCPRGVLPGQRFQVAVPLPAAVPPHAPHAALGREETFTRAQAGTLNNTPSFHGQVGPCDKWPTDIPSVTVLVTD